MKALAALVLFTVLAGTAQAQSVRASYPSALTNTVLDNWLLANTTLKPQDVIAVGGGRVVGMVSRKRQSGSSSMVTLTVRTELVDQAAAEEAQALSETSVLDIDCAGGRAKLTDAQQYAGRNLVGVMQAKPGWSDWITAAPGTTLYRMVSVACQADAPAAIPVATAAKGRAKPKPVEVPAPNPVSPPVAAAPAPAPAPKPAVSTTAAPAPVLHSHGGAAWMQIGAWTDRGQAEAALNKAKAGRPTTVESAQVNGKTYYRALIGGFSDASDAARQCERLKASGGACLIRTH